MEEGTFLGFVIFSEGINIDPRRIEAIKVIVLPHNKKVRQSFLGNINFVRIFISDFMKIVKTQQEIVEAKYIATTTYCTQVIWMRQTLEDIQVKYDEPIPIFCLFICLFLSLLPSPYLHPYLSLSLANTHLNRERNVL